MLRPFMITCIVLAALVLGSTFLPWYTVAGKEGQFTGLENALTAVVNIGLPAMIIALSLLDKEWAARANLFVTGLLVILTIFNFLDYGSCKMGVCLHRKVGLYTSLISASLCFVVLVFDRLVVKVFFPPMPPGAWYNGSTR